MWCDWGTFSYLNWEIMAVPIYVTLSGVSMSKESPKFFGNAVRKHLRPKISHLSLFARWIGHLQILWGFASWGCWLLPRRRQRHSTKKGWATKVSAGRQNTPSTVSYPVQKSEKAAAARFMPQWRRREVTGLCLTMGDCRRSQTDPLHIFPYQTKFTGLILATNFFKKLIVRRKNFASHC